MKAATYVLPLILLLMLGLSPNPASAQTVVDNDLTEQAAEETDSAPREDASIDRVPRRRARNVDLDAPVTPNRLDEIQADVDNQIQQGSGNAQTDTIEELSVMPHVSDMPDTPTDPFVMLDTEVYAGTSARLAWEPHESFAGISAPTPVLVVHGVNPGPVLCLTAAVHGDELNGIEMVRRILYNLDPNKLTGTVVGVPIVNLIAFKRASRYLPDRRDLNRYFPGNPTGSSASRIAYSFFTQVVLKCDVMVDLHTGSFYRTNLPQLRADLRNAEVVNIAEGFYETAIIHSPGAKGSLRRAATEAGIPTVTLEAGEPLRLQAEEVEHGVRGVYALMDQMGMYRKLRVWGNAAPVHYESRWVRADSGGILFAAVKLNQVVAQGEFLGSVTDPITNVRKDIISPYNGRIIGMAVDQVVLPGFAAFHIGIETTTDNLYEPLPPLVPPPTQPDLEDDDQDYDPDSVDNIENS